MMKLKSPAIIALALFIGACSTDRSDRSDRSLASAEGKEITADLRFSATPYDDVMADVRTDLMQTYPELRNLITDSRPSYGVLLVTPEQNVDAVNAIIEHAKAYGQIPADLRVAPEYNPSNSDGSIRYLSYYLIHEPADLIPVEPVIATEGKKNGNTVISLQFNGADIDSWETVTRKHIGQPLAIIVNGRVVSAPIIMDKITGGKAMITGLFDHELYETLTKKGQKAAVKH
jgi:lipoprotein